MLDLNEIKVAKLLLSQWAQIRHFPGVWEKLNKGQSIPVKHPLYKLSPFLDKKGTVEVIRLAGRLKSAEHLRFEARFPVLLPANDDLTKLLLWHYHTKVLNHCGGVNSLLSFIQKRFSVVHPVPSARKVVAGCVVCRKRDLKSATQIMADLPNHRIPAGVRVEPFQSCAADCAGPFLVSQGRGRSPAKRYMAVFRCTVIGAVHLEPLSCLDTDAFILGFERFQSLYAKPELMVTDNGSNFVRSAKEMKRMHQEALFTDQRLEAVDMEKVASKCSVRFKFSPSSSPCLLYTSPSPRDRG